MHRLSYHSHALDTSPAALDAIYAEAVAFNASACITGALLFLDGRWAQILEGDEAAVTGLYDRISGDARHDHVTFDYMIETDGRLFPGWSMGRITDDDKADLPLARIFAAVAAADSDTSIRQLRSLAQAARAPLGSPDRDTDRAAHRSQALDFWPQRYLRPLAQRLSAAARAPRTGPRSAVQDAGFLLLELGLGQHARREQLAELLELGDPVTHVDWLGRGGWRLRRRDGLGVGLLRLRRGRVLRSPPVLLPTLDPAVHRTGHGNRGGGLQ